MIHTSKPSKPSIYFQCILWAFSMFAFAVVGAIAFAGNGGYLVQAVVGNVFINVLLANIHIYVIFPHFFLRKKYFFYVLAALSVLVLSIIIKVFMIFLFSPETNLTGHDPNQTAPAIAAITSVFAFIFSFLFRMIDRLIEKEKYAAELKEAQLTSELGFLRSQINPHSLFNILNTIYSMIYTGSEKAGDTVLKLSELMRFMLYETNDELIPISEEIKYIRTYIELYTIKQKEETTVTFTSDSIPEQLQIPPLVLVPFIENAFKHGNWDSVEPKGWIKGNVNIADTTLHFTLSNSVHSSQKKYATPIGGIGIQNVQKRLDLLFPDRHELLIDRSDHKYSVSLTLEIAQL